MSFDYSAHNAKVAALAARMKERPAGQYVSIRKNTPHHQVRNTAYKKDYFKLDVSALDQVLGIHETEGYDGTRVMAAVCEGQVVMGSLAKFSLPRGYVGACVPEFDNFTVAGLINGQGIQTSSFRYGIFTSTVVAIEVLLGSGEVVRCSPTERRDLFTAMADSHGTLGIVTLAEIQVVPAKAYVHSTYTHFTKLSEFATVFDAAVRAQKGDYLEGLSYGKDSYLMIQGTFADSPDGLPVYEPGPTHVDDGTIWYYQYTRDVVIKQGRKQDAIPTADYLFRSMRGLYWMAECHTNLPVLTNRNFGRRLIDRKVFEAIATKGGFTADSKNITTAELERCTINQDLGMKLQRMAEGLAWVHEHIGVTPLWICPVNCKNQLKLRADYHAEHPGRHKSGEVIDFQVDIGIYGEPTVQPYYNRKTMRKVMEFVDFPSTWGVSYLPRDVYHRVQNIDVLDEVREKYHAVGVFAHIDDKTLFRGNADEEDLGYISNWRLQREYGKHWRLKLTVFFSVVAAVIAVAVGSGLRYANVV